VAPPSPDSWVEYCYYSSLCSKETILGSEYDLRNLENELKKKNPNYENDKPAKEKTLLTVFFTSSSCVIFILVSVPFLFSLSEFFKVSLLSLSLH
jgi:hypothetical protein